QWTDLAIKWGILPVGSNIKSYQVWISNLVLARDRDAVVISPTGSGKSLSWVLPLLAQKEGISLVITPYTSLGQDGEEQNKLQGVQSLFLYSEQNTAEDFELAAEGDMLVLYVCPEMLESPTFARLIHSPGWRNRLSAIYIDEAHLLHETHGWRPPYSCLHLLRTIIGEEVPLIALSATCPRLYRASLIRYAGLRPEYTLINLGNFRPELSTIILKMEH
ncbi:P-loop containing nucleoside triphosphate hydrolase protein, partial [Roridomyces roridus]